MSKELRIYDVPLEDVPTRYTGDWAKWFDAAWLEETRSGVVVQWMCDHYALRDLKPAKPNEFLNAVETNRFKAFQAVDLLENISAHPDDKHLVFFHDIWHPVLTQLLYMRDMGPMDIVIAGIAHAGSYTPHDRLWDSNVWARHVEKGWFNQVDLLFVATRYHADLINGFCSSDRRLLKVVDFPVHDLSVIELDRKGYDKGNGVIIFPHRLAVEKQPELFDKIIQDLAPTYPSCIGFKTMEIAKNRTDYFKLLGLGNIAVSLALEETFGIAMIESVLHGCIPLVPSQQPYEDFYPQEFRYRKGDMDKLMFKLKHFLGAAKNIRADKEFQRLMTSFHDRFHGPTQANYIVQQTLDFARG